jgi:hypothetical protein
MFNPKERQKHIRIEHLDIMGPERLTSQILNYKQGGKKDIGRERQEWS